ncbi:MAG: hypothetical protein CBARDCOR_4744 [uncultured Caballeronia sp.]|nr:MAG: hypothetical protein CBARDCOR_4744 [uncultured Caballeronia sp.]
MSSAAMAQVHLGINIGVPAPVVYAPPPVYAVAVLVIGGHGDHYWNGRRYWNRNDWYRYQGGPPYDHRGWHSKYRPQVSAAIQYPSDILPKSHPAKAGWPSSFRRQPVFHPVPPDSRFFS